LQKLALEKLFFDIVNVSGFPQNLLSKNSWKLFFYKTQMIKEISKLASTFQSSMHKPR